MFKKKPQEINIPAIELKEWLDNFSKEKFERLNENIQDNLAKFEEQASKTRELLSELDNAELLNKKISQRELHLMNGNRSTYIKKVTGFLDSLDIKGSSDKNHKEIIEFCEEFEDKLDELNNSSRRSYYILKEFFESEMVKIAYSIKTLESTLVKIKELLNSKEIKEINSLYSKIHNLNEDIIKNETINNELSELKNQLNQTKEKKAITQDKLNGLKLSKEFKDFNDLKQQHESIILKIKEHESEIKTIFLNIDRALRKYKRSSLHEKLIDKYMENASAALLIDKDLEIINVLEKLKDSVEKEHVELKNKEKTVKNLNKITSEFLINKRDEINRINELKKDLNSKIEKISVSMDFKEAEYQLEHFENKISNFENEIDSAVKKQNSLNIELKKEQLQNQLYNITETKIIINS
ncbi:hypothetical protein JXB41_08165 [Candidatus Woesearchaeota archaeon]|nr:hypothetical protein [Candidatus Woesearchaeota archaeon]